MVLSSTRHSRARGNPGLLRRISLDTRSPIKVGDKLRGYDGTQAGIFVLIPKQVFSKEDIVRLGSPRALDTKVW